MEEAALVVLQRVQATQASLTQHSSRLDALRTEFETKAKEVDLLRAQITHLILGLCC